MLRHFNKFYKLDFRKLNLDAYITLYASGQAFLGDICPICGGGGTLRGHGAYKRSAVLYDDGQIFRMMEVKRLICACGRTHAVLPELIIPYRTYSLLFVLMVLKAYYMRSIGHETVVDIAARFEIAVSTLYAWKKRFEEQRALWLGALAAISEAIEEFFSRHIRSAPHASAGLFDFYDRFGFSFMQGYQDTS
jgi:hypothetical protein